jgi:hypothetical protein
MRLNGMFEVGNDERIRAKSPEGVVNVECGDGHFNFASAISDKPFHPPLETDKPAGSIFSLFHICTWPQILAWRRAR